MAFTYTSDLTTDINFIRFKTGDTVEAQGFIDDETITALVTLEGSKEAATIAALTFIIARLSQPDFKADWLQVSHQSARQGYEGLREELRQEFGLSQITAVAHYTFRGDSAATAEPDFTDGRP